MVGGHRNVLNLGAEALRVEDRSSIGVQILQNDNEKIKMEGSETLVQ